MDGDGRKERAGARAALREKRRRSGRVGVARRVEGEGRGAPVTTRYGSLSDRCRYRVAVSPESVGRSPLRHFSLAPSLAPSLARSLSRRPAAGVDSPLPPARGCVLGAARRWFVRSLARTYVHSLATLSSFGGLRRFARAGLKGPIDRAKHGGFVGSRYPVKV